MSWRPAKATSRCGSCGCSSLWGAWEVSSGLASTASTRCCPLGEGGDRHLNKKKAEFTNQLIEFPINQKPAVRRISRTNQSTRQPTNQLVKHGTLRYLYLSFSRSLPLSFSHSPLSVSLSLSLSLLPALRLSPAIYPFLTRTVFLKPGVSLTVQVDREAIAISPLPFSQYLNV